MTDRCMGGNERKDTFHLCLTCGRLKHRDLFETGHITCKDCHREGRSSIRYRENPDGDGWIEAGTEQ